MARRRQVYSAESQVRHLKDVLRAMADGMLHSRYMAYRLCIRDIRAKYTRSMFGAIWDFLDPLVLGSIFYLLMRARVINAGEMPMPYPVFVIYGLLLYQTFCESLTLSVNLMQSSKGLLMHVKMPPEALILSVLFRVLFNSFFRIAVMLFFSLMLRYQAADQGVSSFSLVGFVEFVVLYPLIVLAGMSIGIFLAPFNAIYSDVGRIVAIVLFPLRYASPVLYQLPDTRFFSTLDFVNPMSLILTNLRLLATNNDIEAPGELAIRCAICLAIFLVGWLIFHLSVRVLAERA